MITIASQLEKIKREKRLGLMTHVVVGYPNLEGTETIVKTLIESGSDFIELQIPFSDPIADGPTIMAACDQALANGTNTDTAFELMSRLTADSPVPILFVGYYNTVFHYGVDCFCQKAAEAGAAGLIIPDIPPEEESHEHFEEQAQKHGLTLVRVISPATSAKRLAYLAKTAVGFIYCTSTYGVTGARPELDPRLKEYITKVRQYFKVPIAVGFGISKKEHIDSLSNVADIAVIGSKIITIVKADETSPDNYIANIRNFILALNL